MYISISALVIVILTVLGVSGFLRIMVIDVEGTARYSPEDIIMASGVSKGDNLLFLDTESIEERIVSAMPFVSSAAISRVLPDGIVIEIEESVPVAAIRTNYGIIIIDSDGRVLEMVGVAAPGLIDVIGVTPVSTTVGQPLRTEITNEAQHLREILTMMERGNILNDVSDIDFTNIGRISFGYTERFRVILGEPNNLQQKINWILNPDTVVRINREFGADAIGEINVSNPSEVGFLVTP